MIPSKAQVAISGIQALEFPALHAGLQHSFDLVDKFLAINLVEGPANRLAQLHHLLAGKPDDCPLFGGLSQDIFDQQADALAAGDRLGLDMVESAFHIIQVRFQDRQKKLLFILEVVIQGGFGDSQ